MINKLRKGLTKKWLRLLSETELQKALNKVDFKAKIIETPEEALNFERESFLDLFSKYVWIYAGVYAISSTLAQIPLKFFKREEGRKVLVEKEHEVWKLFYPPNLEMSSYDLIEATFGYLELTGDCYWNLVFENSTPIAIYVLRPDWVSPIISKSNGKIVGYKYGPDSSREVEFEKDEVIHFKYFNPLSHLDGISGLSSAKFSVICDLYAIMFNKNFFKKGARPSGVLETDRTLTDDTILKLKKQFMKAYSGYEKAFEIPVLEAGLRFRETLRPQKDMEFSNLREMSRDEILGALGVPPSKVQYYKGASYASALEMKRSFYEDTIIPKARKLEAHLNELVLPKFWPGIECGFDFSGVDALKENWDIKSRIIERLLRCGYTYINELRAEEGKPPVEWGDKPFLITAKRGRPEGIGHSKTDRDVGIAENERLTEYEGPTKKRRIGEI